MGYLLQGGRFERGVVLPGGPRLLVFLRPSSKDVEQDLGSVYKCQVTSVVSFRPILSDVDDVSFSDDESIASVKELYKDPKHKVDGDADVLPTGYVAEIRRAQGELIVSPTVDS